MQNNEIEFAGTFLVILAFIGFLGLIGMLFFVVFMFGYSSKKRNYDKQRGDEMQLVSEKIGFDFKAQANLDELPFLSQTNFFEGVSQSLENLMIGELKEHKAAVFDLLYQKKSMVSEDSPVFKQTILVIESERLNLPKFQVRQSNSGETFSPKYQKLNLQFPKNPKFNNDYSIYGENSEALNKVFSYQLLEFYENNQPFFTLGDKNYLFIYQSGKLISPNEIQQWLKVLGFLYNLLRA